ncbi:uncharacterized protein BCR38DRAFT_510001 [Pseudomassariella vexata]|uniref:Uncharacterized protein n=1 Tax=Pseudomassariella vexata TaxID=1141098 RepID=A0A1Y2E6S1_9PEZI|nr:uncharacterized protein BCR38DRAFT_510001 [Pseudomassariella vexata]ORY67273.1 hypothetical protein BCR38DRAFT_510001 [Pseudomassariella vexata]
MAGSGKQHRGDALAHSVPYTGCQIVETRSQRPSSVLQGSHSLETEDRGELPLFALCRPNSLTGASGLRTCCGESVDGTLNFDIAQSHQSLPSIHTNQPAAHAASKPLTTPDVIAPPSATCRTHCRMLYAQRSSDESEFARQISKSFAVSTTRDGKQKCFGCSNPSDIRYRPLRRRRREPPKERSELSGGRCSSRETTPQNRQTVIDRPASTLGPLSTHASGVRLQDSRNWRQYTLDSLRIHPPLPSPAQPGSLVVPDFPSNLESWIPAAPAAATPASVARFPQRCRYCQMMVSEMQSEEKRLRSRGGSKNPKVSKTATPRLRFLTVWPWPPGARVLPPRYPLFNHPAFTFPDQSNQIDTDIVPVFLYRGTPYPKACLTDARGLTFFPPRHLEPAAADQQASKRL